MFAEKIEPVSTNKGDFVLESQELADKEGHRNVSKLWFDQTTTPGEERDLLIASRDQRYTLSSSLGRITPVASRGRWALRVRDRLLYFDTYSGCQFGTMIGMGAEYPMKLIESGHSGDAEMLAAASNHSLRASDQSKEIVLQIDREDDQDTLRGIVSARSNIYSNEWVLAVIGRAIPEGRLSHRRGDAYTLRANVLIPDTIREEADSEYGALVSFSNCEILKCGFSLRPSLFRAICMNGCIWGETKGQRFRVNRRETPDLGTLEKAIKQHIEAQIPLSISALDRLLATRSFSTSVSIKPVLAQVAQEYRLNKKLALSVLEAWYVESRLTPDLGHTLFGVVNAVTRAGQALDDRTWVKCDELGGRLAQLSRDEWDSLITLASKLTAKEVEARFATWSLAV